MVEGHLENPHDRFFKDLLGRPGVAADFLANYLPPELLAHLDVTDPEALSGTFVDDDLREHLSDALFRVRDRTGAAALVYVLLEHKSTPWPWTPLQLLRYVVAIWEQARREGHTSLPVIIPVVFYHGQTRWNVATDVAGLVAHHDEPALRAWTPSFRYWLCDLSRFSPEVIKGGALLRAGLSVLRYVFTDELPERLREIFQLIALLEQQSVTEYLGTVLRYLAATGTPLRWQTVKTAAKEALKEQAEALMKAPFVTEIWQEALAQGLEQGREQGREQGHAQGSEQGKRLEALHIVLRQLRRRVGPLPPELESTLTTFPLETLEALSEALLDFQTQAEALAWVQQAQHQTPPRAE
ncbi:Rpn family recombination-promoting nuclease/putative transposase [Chloracidobacterium aggregatum]|jgi:predicted transposase YdaD|uniref:Rpn family recombination-promoting nuclease/putative transposase n=1 Tax=Chloracidobacterium sp. N TaxID=2821540 RepID=A0ABX8B1U7_9BACT|nr:Rpn family recombination-promoting nuclease/putative transposase [Chloracidobacterium aggregatum]QUV84565.1 Rpn family recombination-promoting nuclease/putative transposase [Chloracidobacterium sp. 2]QUV86938.1 Rpn family recombination-promoting nuclease/putative transposase [Chloracidobacterium sp. S]QUV89850.1 Rpn family recombination-promoting nuclease/putative transposase [Chloracidobacterium sp. A]QUV93061.1 Rpn family recombination-promoting nuclease/putative transposase [Chloracidobac